MLVLVAVVTVNSYNQEWKRYQRAYLNEQLTKKFVADNKREPHWLEQLNIALNTELNLKIRKVVTETGRSADLCMSCHVNVEKLTEQHKIVNHVEAVAKLEAEVKELNTKIKATRDIQNKEEEDKLTKQLEAPQSELNKLISRQFAFDSVGCAACHGGDRLALTMNAHKEMRLDFQNVFEENLEKLHSDHWMVRQEGIEHIRWMTGQDFGFSFSASPAAREASIGRVTEWWNLHKDTFLAEGYGERSSPFKTANLMAERVAKRPDIAFDDAEPLKFVGSGTCIACHSQPQISDTYIPDSHKTHVERWFRDAFMTSKNKDIYKDHPFIDEETLKTMDVTCEACHGPGSEYMKLMQKGLALDAQTKAFNIQIEELKKKLEEAEKAGHTSEVDQLKKQIAALSAESSADSTRASEVLSKAKTLARCNARRNMSDPRIWALLERLIEKAGPSAQAGQGPEPDPKTAANIRCE